MRSGRIVRDVLGRDRDLEQLELRLGREISGIAALVELRAYVEAAREALEGIAGLAGGEARDDAGVEPAGDVGADRHVRAQVQPHGVLHELVEAVREVALGVVEVGLVLHFPVALHRDLAVPHDQVVARQQLLDAAEERLAVQARTGR